MKKKERKYVYLDANEQKKQNLHTKLNLELHDKQT
jgi:hypothetical protein